jgi:hypothetical protein
VSNPHEWAAAWPGFKLSTDATLSQLDACPDMDLDAATPDNESSQADYELTEDIPPDTLPSAFLSTEVL